MLELSRPEVLTGGGERVAAPALDAILWHLCFARTLAQAVEAAIAVNASAASAGSHGSSPGIDTAAAVAGLLEALPPSEHATRALPRRLAAAANRCLGGLRDAAFDAASHDRLGKVPVSAVMAVASALIIRPPAWALDNGGTSAAASRAMVAELSFLSSISLLSLLVSSLFLFFLSFSNYSSIYNKVHL